MFSKSTISLVLCYGIVILSLGCYGYYMTGSLASLLSGGISGGLLILSALSMFAGQSLGAYTALVVTIFLTGLFSYRYALTGKGIPAILAVLSAAILLFLLAKFGKWKASTRP